MVVSTGAKFSGKTHQFRKTCATCLHAPDELHIFRLLKVFHLGFMMEVKMNDYVRVLSATSLWLYFEGNKHMPIKYGENYQ